MQLTPSPDQRELKDAVERFCQAEVTAARLMAWARVPRGIERACWDAIAGMGWFGLGLPAACGGSGLGLVDVAVLLQECGRGLIPRSVINAIHAGWALGRLDPAAPELRDLASGARVLALALDEEQARDWRHFATTMDAGAAAPTVHGEKWYVANGIAADWHLVAAREGGGVALVLVAGDDTERHPLRTFDGDEQARVCYAGATVRRVVTPAEQGASQLARLRREGSALALAEMVGGMQAALDTTVAYVKEREQFGQKLAVFQAVQHQVADMATAFTAARHLAWQAITRIDAGTEEGGELDTAIAFTAPAFKRVTWTAHHLHGGAGFVVEHPLHHHSERAQALTIRFAPEAAALDAVASSLLD